ncbi:unnamed protein product [Coffea canephora]|uniref:TF-B3 domain-containing protein n=1 Tax=Coffea canephora TaxID=49390 RepID=A0A068UWG8_COFCA|nr:unnamed protein product [Coffea canephora]
MTSVGRWAQCGFLLAFELRRSYVSGASATFSRSRHHDLRCCPAILSACRTRCCPLFLLLYCWLVKTCYIHLRLRFCLLNSSYYLISTSAIQSFSDMVYKWSVVFGDRSFEKGWDEYCHENITNKHDMLLLRHIGHLIFDVIHFSELQK